MTPLTPAEQASRRALDYDAMQATARLCTAFVDNWSAFASIADAESTRRANQPQDVRVFEAVYKIRSPIARDRYYDKWWVRFDLSSPNHPKAEPTILVLSKERPWVPHVSPAGVFCLGTLWSPERTAAHLLVDVARILNFDENLAKLKETTIHFNSDSIRWWETKHSARPITPIRYPEVVVPAAIGKAALDDLFGT